MVDASVYIPNYVLHGDLQIPSIKEDMQRFCFKDKDRLAIYPNVPNEPETVTNEEPRRRTALSPLTFIIDVISA